MGTEDRPSTAVTPSRATRLETTPGRCGNLDYCTIGMQRVLVHVPIGQPFVCPECATKLRAPGALPRDGHRPLLTMLRIAVLLAAMAASATAGYGFGRAQAALRKAVQSATLLASAPSPPPVLAPPKVASAAPSPAAAPPTSQPARQSASMVPERTYPAHMPALELPDPAERLLHESHFGQVTIDCLLEPASAHPVCKATSILGADTFSAAAIQWLQSIAIQYGPPLRTNAPIAPDHRWRVVLDDFSGLSRHSVPTP